MPKQSSALSYEGYNELYFDILEGIAQQYQVPVLDPETGFPTGESYDIREEQREGQPQPLRLKEHLEYLSQTQGFQPQKGQPIPDFQLADPYQSEGTLGSLSNIAKLAYNKSLMGTAQQAITGEEPFDMAGFQANKLESVASEVLSFFTPVDIASLYFGGGIGGALVKTAIKDATKKLIAKSIKRGLSKKTATRVAERVVQREMKQIGKRVASQMAVSSTAIGSYSGLRGFFESKIEKGEYVVGDAIKDGLQGMAFGAILGAAGGAVPGVIAGSKLFGKTGKLGAEIMAFGTAAPFIEEGRAPTGEDYLNAAQFILGLRLAHAGGKMGKNVFRNVIRKANDMQKEGQATGRDYNEQLSEEVANVVEEIKPITSGVVKIEPELARGEAGFKPPKIVSRETVKPLLQGERGKVVAKKDVVKPEVKKQEFNFISRQQNKEIFGKYNPDVKLSSRSVKTRAGKTKTTFRLEKAKTVEEVNDVLKYSESKGANLYLDKALENTDIFKQLKKEKMLSPRRFQGRFKVSPKEPTAITLLTKPIKEDPHKFSGLAAFKNKVATNKLGEFAKGLWKKSEGFRQIFHQSENLAKLPESKKVFKEMETSTAIEHELHSGFADGAIELGWKADMKKPAGETLGKSIPKDARWQGYFGRILNRYNEVVELKDKTGKFKLRKVNEYFPRDLKQEVREKLLGSVQVVSKYLDGIKDKDLTDQLLAEVIRGKSLRKSGYLLSKDVEGFKGRPVLVTAIEHLIRHTKKPMTIRQAFRKLEREVTSDYFMDVSYTKKRTLELPSSFYETDARIVIPRYIKAMSRRIAEIEVFGVDEKNIMKKLHEIHQKDPQEAKIVEKILTMWSGTYNIKHALTPGWRKAVDAYMAIEVATKIGLGRATLLNFSQWTISFMPKFGIWQTVLGGMDILNPEYRKKLKKAGVVDNYDKQALMAMTGELPGGWAGKLAEFTTKWSGFSWVNRANLYWAASTYNRAVKEWIPQARGTGKRAELRRKQLKEFGIDYRKNYTDKELQRGMFTFATNSQLLKNVLKEPLFFGDPRLRPFVLFKRFGYRQFVWIKDMLVTEAKRNNYMPHIRLAVGGYLSGAAVVWGLNQIKHMLSGEPVYRKDDDLWDEFIENIAIIGAFGVISDMVEIEKLSYLPSKLEFTVAPVILSDISKGLEAMSSVLRDYENYGDAWLATKRNAHQAFDLMGSYPRYAAQRLKTVGQKANKIRFLKGREKKDIFELILDGNSKAASKRIANWNKHYIGNPLTYSDINFSELRKYLERRVKAKAEQSFDIKTPEGRKELRKGRVAIRQKLQKVREEEALQEIRAAIGGR